MSVRGKVEFLQNDMQGSCMRKEGREAEKWLEGQRGGMIVWRGGRALNISSEG